MSKNIMDYLLPDMAAYDEEGEVVEITYKIKEAGRNPFRPPENKATRHWALTLGWRARYVGDYDPEDLEWRYGDEIYDLKFHLSCDSKPTIEQFSEAVYSECRPVLLAAHQYDKLRRHHLLKANHGDIEIRHIYEYVTLRSGGYEKTKDFVSDYDFWYNCFYQTLKWIHRLRGRVNGAGRVTRTGDWQTPVGNRLLDFLDLEWSESEGLIDKGVYSEQVKPGDE